MGLALEHAGLEVGDIAEYLGVHTNSVWAWLSGRRNPKRQTLILWSLRCGVPFEWLETGKEPSVGGPDDGVTGTVTPGYHHEATIVEMPRTQVRRQQRAS